MFKIGNVEIKNNVVLAPMAGISNPAYIKICEEFGLGYAVTELISAEAIVRNNKKTIDMLNGIDNLNIPVGVQIFGSNPTTMAKAAKILVDLYNIKIIDINMGCPVPKVAIKSQAGSFLLKDPKKIKEIVQAVVETVDIPVTVKIRIGWDSNSINASLVAKICEEAGASAIAVHGRTRAQGYSGNVNLDVIKEVKETVNIPVIGNGDIKSWMDAKKMLDYTKCDAVMIGRGALGNPWLINEVVSYLKDGRVINKPTYKEKINMCYKHLDYLLEIKNEKVAVLEMRSHISWYLKGIPNTQVIKEACFKATTKDELISILSDFEKKLN